MNKEKIRNYEVSFSGLKLGAHKFQFRLDQAFFDLFEFEQDFESPNLVADIEFIKSSTFLEFILNLSGSVQVQCDLSMDKFEQPIQNESKLVVKFGEYYDFIDDEIWVIPYGEHSINIAQYLYEIVLLSIPQKRIHPNVLNGTSASKVLKLIHQYQPKKEEEIKQKKMADPRWEALKKWNTNN